MVKKILFILVLSLLFIRCDDSGKKKVIPPFASQDQQEGTLIVDDGGNVIVTDGTVPEGNTISVVAQDTGSTGNTAGDQTTTGSTQQTAPQPTTTSGDNTADTTGDSSKTATAPSEDKSKTEEAPQIPAVDPVDNLTKNDSQFAKYDVHSSAGVYWIKDLYQDGKAIFGWEFPPSFTIKVQSIEPGAKVTITMYGVYSNKETDVYYQYMVSQKQSNCKADGKKDNKCAMEDIEIDGSKWLIMGGKNYKYAYVEFHVLDEKGNEITSTTKAKINVHVTGTALTAFLTKIKVHPTPAFIAVTLLLLGIIVGINLLRRRMA